MFWYLLPARVIGGQVHRVPPISEDEWEEKKILFEEKKQEELGRNKPRSVQWQGLRHNTCWNNSGHLVSNKGGMLIRFCGHG